MNNKTNQKLKAQKTPTVDDSIPDIPQVEPPRIGMGHPEFHFMQIALEIQKSLGEMKSDIKQLNSTQESMKGKVDDLVRWKTLILGGAIALGVVTTGIFTLIGKFSEYITFGKPVPTQPQQSPAASLPSKSESAQSK